MAKCNKLVTKTAFKNVPALYATEEQPKEKKIAHVKIFGALTDHRHYIFEYDPETGEAFCLTTNREICEYGYISIPELQRMNDNFMQEDPNHPGRRRFIIPPWERELHGSGYNAADIEAAHARSY